MRAKARPVRFIVTVYLLDGKGNYTDEVIDELEAEHHLSTMIKHVFSGAQHVSVVRDREESTGGE